MTPTPLPDWSIITHTSGTHAGKIEFQTNMFQRKGSLSGNKPSVDLFKSFVEFVVPTDTEGTCGAGDCDFFDYNHMTTGCGSTAWNPDDVLPENSFDGGLNRYKERSSYMFQKNMNIDLTETASITCVKCWRGTSIVWIKPVHWSRYGSCHTK